MALDLAGRYADASLDFPDVTVMAMAAKRQACVLTWDFRHFRLVVPRKGEVWSLLVEEAELPSP